jgi:hypothetical protein
VEKEGGRLDSLLIRPLTQTEAVGMIQLASEVSLLRSFYIRSSLKLKWTTDLVQTFANGFLSVKYFSIRLGRLSSRASGTIPAPHPQTRISADVLSLTSGGSSNGSTPLDSFLKLFDLTNMRRCSIGGVIICSRMFSELAVCPALSRLIVQLSSRKFARQLPHVVTHLPRLKALQTFKLYLWEPDNIIESSITLPALLAAFPPQLRYVNARQLSFPDFDSVPFREPPASLLPDIPRVEALLPIEGTDDPLTVWKDVRGGNEEWCCHVEEAETWNEVDEM